MILLLLKTIFIVSFKMILANSLKVSTSYGLVFVRVYTSCFESNQSHASDTTLATFLNRTNENFLQKSTTKGPKAKFQDFNICSREELIRSIITMQLDENFYQELHNKKYWKVASITSFISNEFETLLEKIIASRVPVFDFKLVLVPLQEELKTYTKDLEKFVDYMKFQHLFFLYVNGSRLNWFYKAYYEQSIQTFRLSKRFCLR